MSMRWISSALITKVLFLAGTAALGWGQSGVPNAPVVGAVGWESGVPNTGFPACPVLASWDSDAPVVGAVGWESGVPAYPVLADWDSDGQAAKEPNAAALYHDLLNPVLNPADTFRIRNV